MSAEIGRVSRQSSPALSDALARALDAAVAAGNLDLVSKIVTQLESLKKEPS